jgi:hypothetical protein
MYDYVHTCITLDSLCVYATRKTRSIHLAVYSAALNLWGRSRCPYLKFTCCLNAAKHQGWKVFLPHIPMQSDLCSRVNQQLHATQLISAHLLGFTSNFSLLRFNLFPLFTFNWFSVHFSCSLEARERSSFSVPIFWPVAFCYCSKSILFRFKDLCLMAAAGANFTKAKN